MIRTLGPMVLFASVLAPMAVSLWPSVAAEPEKPIRISELIVARPIGLLGNRLGKRIVVEGTLAKRVMLANPIAITRVDDRALADVVNIEVTGDKALKLENNINYKLEGYESGAFGGYPGWLAPEAQQPFQYHASFVVTRVIAPAE